MLFRQLFDRKSCTYTYILADETTREAILIDTVKECNDRDLKLIEELGLKVAYLLETHIHADHVTGVKKIKKVTGAKFALGKGAQHPQADILFDDKGECFFGNYKITALATPGHTKSCTTYACEKMLFTGDALFIRGCGRTDFQGGDAAELYESVHQKIFSQPDDMLVYPGHDYQGRTVSTVGEEKHFNPRLKRGNSLKDFCDIMNNLNLPYPKLMDKSVPENLNCLG